MRASTDSAAPRSTKRRRELDVITPYRAPASIELFHNPWPQQIDPLFAAVGLANASRGISWQRASPNSVITNLEDLVRTRNKIARTTDVDVAKTTVTRLRKYVEGFTKRLDEEVETSLA